MMITDFKKEFASYAKNVIFQLTQDPAFDLQKELDDMIRRKILADTLQFYNYSRLYQHCILWLKGLIFRSNYKLNKVWKLAL